MISVGLENTYKIVGNEIIDLHRYKRVDISEFLSKLGNKSDELVNNPFNLINGPKWESCYIPTHIRKVRGKWYDLFDDKFDLLFSISEDEEDELDVFLEKFKEGNLADSYINNEKNIWIMGDPEYPVIKKGKYWEMELYFPTFLLVWDKSSSALYGGYPHPKDFDFEHGVFKDTRSMRLIFEPSNTYSTGILCIAESKSMIENVHRWKNDEYNSDLTKDYFVKFILKQYTFRKEGLINDVEFLEEFPTGIDLVEVFKS